MQPITKIYVGKDKACRCGCKGDYFYPDDQEFESLVEEFQKKWKLYNARGKVQKDDIDESYYNISYSDGTAMTAYFD